MDLHIITPEWNETLQVNWVELNTESGNYIIQKGHIPTILLLSADEELLYKPLHQPTQYILVVHGVIHVTRTAVTALISVEE